MNFSLKCFVIFFVLAIISVTTGCVSRLKTSSGGASVGEIYIIPDGATITWCERFTGGPLLSTELQDCLIPRGTRPEFGQVAKGELVGPLRLRVSKIRFVNAIDALDELVFIEDISTGKRYLDSGVLRRGTKEPASQRRADL